MNKYATYADQLTASGIKFPDDTVIFESSEVLAWVENVMTLNSFDEISAICDTKRTMPVYEHCFVEAKINDISAGMFVTEIPISDVIARAGSMQYFGLETTSVNWDSVVEVASHKPTANELQSIRDLLHSAFKFFIYLPLIDYGWGLIALNAAIGVAFDGYGQLSAVIMDSSIGGYSDEIYSQLGIKHLPKEAALPRSVLYMALVAMSHIHHRGEVELVTHPRHVVRKYQRECGKAPSPFFRIVHSARKHKVYEQRDGSHHAAQTRHWVSGHFRTTIDHPIEWFNGTKFIKTHERGKGAKSDDNAPRYRIRLD